MLKFPSDNLKVRIDIDATHTGNRKALIEAPDDGMPWMLAPKCMLRY